MWMLKNPPVLPGDSYTFLLYIGSVPIHYFIHIKPSLLSHTGNLIFDSFPCLDAVVVRVVYQGDFAHHIVIFWQPT